MNRMKSQGKELAFLSDVNEVELKVINLSTLVDDTAAQTLSSAKSFAGSAEANAQSYTDTAVSKVSSDIASLTTLVNNADQSMLDKVSALVSLVSDAEEGEEIASIAQSVADVKASLTTTKVTASSDEAVDVIGFVEVEINGAKVRLAKVS